MLRGSLAPFRLRVRQGWSLLLAAPQVSDMLPEVIFWKPGVVASAQVRLVGCACPGLQLALAGPPLEGEEELDVPVSG